MNSVFRRRLRPRVILLLSLSAFAPDVWAQKAVSASGGWVKAPAAGETSAAAYVVIENPTMYDVYVARATTDVAGQVQFREAPKSAGAAAKILPELTVPAFGSLELTPEGVHAVLVDLKRPLKEGDQVSLSLTTDGGVVLEVPAVVRAKQ